MKKENTYLLIGGVILAGYLLYYFNKEEEETEIEDIIDPNNLAGAVSSVIDDTGEVETDSGDTEEAEVDLNTGTTTLDPNQTGEDPSSGETIFGDVLVTPYDRVQVRVRNLADGLYEFKAIVNTDVIYVDQSGYNPDFQYPPISAWQFTTFDLNNGQGPINLAPDEVIEVQYTENATIPISAQWDFDNSLYDPTVNFELEVVYSGNVSSSPNQGNQQEQTSNLGDQ